MRVIGAGFGRTGTLSLKTALDTLGFDPCYHMVEVMERPDHQRKWYAACHGGMLDFSMFDGFGSVVDWPAAHYWRELIAHYPKAKVVLSVREGEGWYKSVTDTIYGRITQPVPPDATEEMRLHRLMTQKIILEETFGGRFLDKKHAIDVFERHNEDVRKTVEPSRLLVFNVKEGWGPLCDFLGVSIPAEPFPRVNDTASFLAWHESDDMQTPK